MLDGTVSLAQAAALAACLPQGSLCLGGESEPAGWTRTDLLLLAVVNSMRAEPIDPFGRPDVVAMGEDEMAELLSRPRVDVGGNEAI